MSNPVVVKNGIRFRSDDMLVAFTSLSSMHFTMLRRDWTIAGVLFVIRKCKGQYIFYSYAKIVQLYSH